jgi:oligoribonuclease
VAKFLWFDCETGGLDENSQPILEMAVIITDNQLNQISSAQWVIGTTREQLDAMEQFSVSTHQASGLCAEALNSRITLKQAESEILSLIQTAAGSEIMYLAGSSVSFDRKFIHKYLPALDARMHYRMLDVTSYWIGLTEVVGLPVPKGLLPVHRAMPDIEESFELFKTMIGRFK